VCVWGGGALQAQEELILNAFGRAS
jgi:hypothetical protein